MAKLPRERAYIASVWTSGEHCDWNDCESWKTVTLEVVGHRNGTPIGEVDYTLCLKHLGEFIDEMYFKSDRSVIVHGDGTIEE